MKQAKQTCSGARMDKLSRLQWKIIGDVIRGKFWVQMSHTEAQRVARVRAVTRLVARGVLKRQAGDYWGKVAPMLIVSLDELERAAHEAWSRDETRGMSERESPAWGVLRAIEEARRQEKLRARRIARKAKADPRALHVWVLGGCKGPRPLGHTFT